MPLLITFLRRILAFLAISASILSFLPTSCAPPPSSSSAASSSASSASPPPPFPSIDAPSSHHSRLANCLRWHRILCDASGRVVALRRPFPVALLSLSALRFVDRSEFCLLSRAAPFRQIRLRLPNITCLDLSGNSAALSSNSTSRYPTWLHCFDFFQPSRNTAAFVAMSPCRKLVVVDDEVTVFSGGAYRFRWLSRSLAERRLRRRAVGGSPEFDREELTRNRILRAGFVGENLMRSREARLDARGATLGRIPAGDVRWFAAARRTLSFTNDKLEEEEEESISVDSRIVSPAEQGWRRRRALVGFDLSSPVIITAAIAIASVICVLLTLGTIAACCVCRRRRRRRQTEAAEERRRRWQQRRSGKKSGGIGIGIGGGSKLFRVESNKVFDPSLESISMRDLVKATENFNYKRVIGDGGFGLVYEAALKDGRRVAVKRLAYGGFQGQREFEAEMETLGSIKHQNLVELLAYSQVGDDRLLVYEFVENGSLDRWLHEEVAALDWRRRLSIAVDSATGLLYLHEDCNPNIIHRDIKSSNILLGRQFQVKIADFGLARLMSPLVSHVSTDVAGTIGYMAPEYGLGVGATKQADVYSFGMVLLELATGRRPDALVESNGMKSLASWAVSMFKRGRHMELLDPRLLNNNRVTLPPPQDQVQAYIQIACDCIHDAPQKRPTMKDVLDRLSSIAP